MDATYTQIDGVLTAHVESGFVSKGIRRTRRTIEVTSVLVERVSIFRMITERLKVDRVQRTYREPMPNMRHKPIF